MGKLKQSFRQRAFPSIGDVEDAAKNRKPNSAHYDRTGLEIGILSYRWIRSLVVAGALLWAGYQTIGNHVDYSKGQRVGVVNKISEKGLIWETKEGQLSLEGRTSTGQPTGAGIWNFSIDKTAKNGENVDELFYKLNEYMEKGTRVKINYLEPLATWPWRADTDYLIQSIVPLENK